MMHKRLTQSMVFMFAACVAGQVHANNKPFGLWLEQLKQDAVRSGISTSTVESSLSDLTVNEKVIALDRKQPEGTKSFEEYMEGAVSERRISRAIEEFKRHQPELERIGRTYGVQPEFIVALWGIESNFGDNMGNMSVVRSLATLAYDGRRSAYFRDELIKALRIIDEGHISAEDMVGSWAGAMGMCQFMPSSFYNYAVDGDRDGKIDIWNDKDDVFASIANYLSSVGWDDSVNWGEAVDRAHGANIVSGNHNGEGPYFKVTKNYHNILKWNRSRYFAIAVGTLADEIHAGVY